MWLLYDPYLPVAASGSLAAVNAEVASTSPVEIFTRRNLPHWYVPGAAHFVTYRLAGTIPAVVLDRFREERKSKLARLPATGTDSREGRAQIHEQFYAEYDHYLDCICKIDWLANPTIAELIRENLYHHNGVKYHLLSYCVMPNHVHILIQPIDPEFDKKDAQISISTEAFSDEILDRLSPLARIMHSLKSYTAHEANKILRRTGQFWQHESYDHWVRHDDELERTARYIADNPVKANLVAKLELWPYCSARDRFLRDGSRSGWLIT